MLRVIKLVLLLTALLYIVPKYNQHIFDIKQKSPLQNIIR